MNSELFQSFANAPFASDGWTTALGTLASATGSARAQIIGVGGPHAIPFNYVTDVGDERLLAKFVEIGGGDPRVNWRVKATRASFEIVTEDDYAALNRQRRFDIYNDFVRDFDMPYGCQTALSNASDGLLGLATLRTQSDGETSAEQLQLFADVAPAVLRAIRMQQGLHHQGLQLLTGTMEAMSSTTFLLDSWGRVVAKTVQAERAVTGQTVLRLKHGLLRALDRASDRRLQEAIARQVRGLNEGRARRFWLAAVGDTERGFVGEIYPLPRQDWSFGAAAQSMLVLWPLGGTKQDAERILSEALGLTSAEAQVAMMIAQGHSRADVARKRGVRPETVGDQLKSIFRKADVHREAELVRLVSQLTG